jgi:methylglutaconyl-CoA hydratase
MAAIDACPKPVVGRIAGHAAGGGAALVAACDISVGHLDIRIGITEVRLGIAPLPVAAMMAHRMTRRNFFEAFLAADMMPAARAVELGLLNVAVPAEALDDTVGHYVNALVRGAPQALADTKAALRFMTESGVEAANAYARETPHGMRGPEAKEGIAAFLQKRNPDWVPD